jgi:hypothetical protein
MYNYLSDDPSSRLIQYKIILPTNINKRISDLIYNSTLNPLNMILITNNQANKLGKYLLAPLNGIYYKYITKNGSSSYIYVNKRSHTYPKNTNSDKISTINNNMVNYINFEYNVNSEYNTDSEYIINSDYNINSEEQINNYIEYDVKPISFVTPLFIHNGKKFIKICNALFNIPVKSNILS